MVRSVIHGPLMRRCAHAEKNKETAPKRRSPCLKGRFPLKALTTNQPPPPPPPLTPPGGWEVSCG